MYKGVLLAALLMVTAQVFSCDEEGHTGFLPENDLYIPVNAEFGTDMTEVKFNAIIDRIDSVYSKIVKEQGGTLKWNRNWTDGTVNASAQRFLSTWTVNMYGGLARHPLVTDDAFALVVCHELGHHLGGAPKIGGFMSKWASNEGQSDYFATLKCFRKVYGSDDNIKIVSEMNVPAIVEDKCRDNFKDEKEVALCIRGAMGGKSLALLLGSLRNTTGIDFDTPDQNVVDTTDNAHPAAQCRLDTYFAGAICDKSANEDVSNKDFSKGVCSRKNGYVDGVRPLCWYKPQN